MTGQDAASEDKRMTDFKTVMALYEANILRYASRLVHQHDTAQNVVQDTFIRLYRRWEDAMTPSPRMLNWLYRTAHNCAVDFLRRESRRQSFLRENTTEEDCLVQPDRGHTSRFDDDAVRAVQALKTLSLREQQLVILKVYEEKSYQEISEISGLSVGNVGYILHHAMRKMATEMRNRAQDEQRKQ